MAEIINLRLMYFVYGLSFYTMGTAIAFQYRSYSNFRLAYSLRLLAAFGLLHGVSEWGNVFIPVLAVNLDLLSIWKAIALQRLLQSVSLFFLFCFGTKLIFDSRRKNYWWFTFPITAFASWLILFSFFIPLLGTNELDHWLLISESWARYLLALPAGLCTAYGLALQIPEVKQIQGRAILDLWVASASFCLFAVSSGIVVPQDVGWFSQIINVHTFQKIIGLPIEVFRTATALTATWSITRILTIFDVEKHRQIMDSRRLEAVYLERERFARDLHDDVIQSVYGVGLQLQTTIPLIRENRQQAINRVECAVKALNDIIHGLRRYIQGLETPQQKDLAAWLVDTAEQYRQRSGLNIEINAKLDWQALNQMMNGLDGWEIQVKQIVREALTNIVQHAQATKAQIDLSVEENCLIIAVKDNGAGTLTTDSSNSEHGRKHFGIKNMRTRAKLMGGNLRLYSEPRVGTAVILSIPLFQGHHFATKGERGHGK